MQKHIEIILGLLIGMNAVALVAVLGVISDPDRTGNDLRCKVKPHHQTRFRPQDSTEIFH